MAAPNRTSASLYLAPIINKTNYQNLPPSNPQTDFDNTKRTYAYCDTAALTQTADRVLLQFTSAASTGALVLNNYWSQWVVVNPNLPTMSRSSAGIYTFTFLTMVSNEYDAAMGITNNTPVNLTGGTGNFASAAGLVAVAASGNVVTVSLFNTSGTAADFVGQMINIRAF